MVGITHGVLFLRIGKDSLDGLTSQSIRGLAKLSLGNLISQLYVFLPDMPLTRF
jgi:hypothetical protein